MASRCSGAVQTGVSVRSAGEGVQEAPDMSHSINSKSLRSRVGVGLPLNSERSSLPDTVNAVEASLRSDSERVCDSPLCDERFEQTGMAVSPKRFCSNACKMDVWAIRRVADLYGLSVAELHEILRGAK